MNCKGSFWQSDKPPAVKPLRRCSPLLVSSAHIITPVQRLSVSDILLMWCWVSLILDFCQPLHDLELGGIRCVIYRQANFTHLLVYTYFKRLMKLMSPPLCGKEVFVLRLKRKSWWPLVKSVYLRVSAMHHKQALAAQDEKLQVWSSARNFKTDLQSLSLWSSDCREKLSSFMQLYFCSLWLILWWESEFGLRNIQKSSSEICCMSRIRNVK